jgi:hypothetical protein
MTETKSAPPMQRFEVSILGELMDIDAAYYALNPGGDLIEFKDSNHKIVLTVQKASLSYVLKLPNLASEDKAAILRDNRVHAARNQIDAVRTQAMQAAEHFAREEATANAELVVALQDQDQGAAAIYANGGPV